MAWNARRRTQRLGTSPSQQQRIHREALPSDDRTVLDEMAALYGSHALSEWLGRTS